MNIKVILKNVTLAFPDIVQPKEFKGKNRWGANFIIETDSTGRLFSGGTKEFQPALQFIQGVLKDASAAEFGGKQPTGKDSAFRDGNDQIDSKTNETRPEFKGKWFVASYRQTTNSKGEPIAPPLITDSRLKAVRPGDPGYPQAGDRVCVILDFYTQGGKSDTKKEYGRKINSGFETIQFLRNGDVSFGSSAPSVSGLEPEEPEADEIDAL